jgi:hypothetical protein
MIGLEKLQLFTNIISNRGEDFYAPMIKSFGYFCEPQSTPPEGGFQTYTFLEIDLFQNSSNQSADYQYQAVHLEGMINPMGNNIPLLSVPFRHLVKVVYESTNPIIVIGELSESEFIEWNNPYDPFIENPVSGDIATSLDSNQNLSLSVNLKYLTPGPQLEPQYKISGKYYLI